MCVGKCLLHCMVLALCNTSGLPLNVFLLAFEHVYTLYVYMYIMYSIIYLCILSSRFTVELESFFRCVKESIV